MEDKKVQTCNFYRVDPNLPHRFNNPDSFHGYGQKKSHACYRTSNQAYGSRKPTVHEMQTQYKVVSHQFSEDMLQTGMYRDMRLNTAMDKSRVTDPMTTNNKRVNIQYLYPRANQSSNHDGNPN
ncbi:piercer of microtubule wall 2 protein [Odontesthes bonariensis]|uniref:piercer of microtubule wall 2 protein n=1 Tax=Odontesthes bonariensis TaxID=219752 RepID=UPI003F5821B0